MSEFFFPNSFFFFNRIRTQGFRAAFSAENPNPFFLRRESPSEEFQFELLHFGFLVEFLIRISAFGRPIPFFCAKNSKMFQRIRALPEFLANFGILR